MRNKLLFVMGSLVLFFIFIFVLPWLFSAKSTGLVLCGVALFLVTSIATIEIGKRFYDQWL